MATVEVERRTVTYLERPMSLIEIARAADPVEGSLGGVVRVGFFDITQEARFEQGGEFDLYSRAFSGCSLPGVQVVRVLGVVDDGVVEDTDLLIELLVDVRTVFWTVEYDLVNDVPSEWGDETLDSLRAALDAWQARDERPQPNPIR